MCDGGMYSAKENVVVVQYRHDIVASCCSGPNAVGVSSKSNHIENKYVFSVLFETIVVFKRILPLYADLQLAATRDCGR